MSEPIVVPIEISLALKEQNKELQDRLVRIESMLAYMLGSMPVEVEAAPTLEQAKIIQAMGNKQPWARIKRSTNR